MLQNAEQETRIVFSQENPEFLNNVYIIILNYNNYKDSLECLESVFRLKYAKFTVIVCDNGSTDSSLEFLQRWAQGNFIPQFSGLGASFLAGNVVPKPIPYLFLDKDNLTQRTINQIEQFQLIFLDNGENIGFGAGNNAGIRLALTDPKLDYVWVLNNDTVVDPDSLIHLVRKMISDPLLGACGNTTLYYHDPEIIQALGGFSFIPWIGMSRQLGHLKKWRSFIHRKDLEEKIEQKMYWIQGASIFLKKEFLEKIGLISEDYFLYSEEQDWGIRSSQIFRSGYASKSIVYHKEGRTTGSNSIRREKKSLFSEFYLTRSRIVFTKKHYPHFLPLICSVQLFLALMRLSKNQLGNALTIILCIIFTGKEKAKQIENEHPFEEFKDWIFSSKILELIMSRFF